jgi:hypothetical protein
MERVSPSTLFDQALENYLGFRCAPPSSPSLEAQSEQLKTINQRCFILSASGRLSLLDEIVCILETESVDSLVSVGLDPQISTRILGTLPNQLPLMEVAEKLLSEHAPAQVVKNLLGHLPFDRVNLLSSDLKIIVSGDALFEEVRVIFCIL